MQRDTQICEVALGPSNEQTEIRTAEFVLDFNGMGQLIGIEILNLVQQAGTSRLRAIDNITPLELRSVRHSYDADSDAFYLLLSDDRSLNQKAVQGEILLNKHREIVAFRWSEGCA